MAESEFSRVGQIVGSFGLKGQVKVQPLTEYVERFDKGARIRLKGEWIEIETSTIHKGRPLVKFKGIDTIDAAEGLQWEFLESDERPELDEDEFLIDDLIGLHAFTEDGEDLGEIEEILQNPAHEVLVIGEIMVPMVKEFVREVDLENERLIVRLIPGMRPGEED